MEILKWDCPKCKKIDSIIYNFDELNENTILRCETGCGTSFKVTIDSLRNAKGENNMTKVPPPPPIPQISPPPTLPPVISSIPVPSGVPVPPPINTTSVPGGPPPPPPMPVLPPQPQNLPPAPPPMPTKVLAQVPEIQSPTTMVPPPVTNVTSSNIDQVAQPPLSASEKTNLEDPGDEKVVVQEDSWSVLLDAIRAYADSKISNTPFVSNRNPFKHDGKLKDEHYIYETLKDGNFHSFKDIQSACGSSIAETTFRNKLKKLDGLAGLKLVFDGNDFYKFEFV